MNDAAVADVLEELGSYLEGFLAQLDVVSKSHSYNRSGLKDHHIIGIRDGVNSAKCVLWRRHFGVKTSGVYFGFLKGFFLYAENQELIEHIATYLKKLSITILMLRRRYAQLPNRHVRQKSVYKCRRYTIPINETVLRSL